MVYRCARVVISDPSLRLEEGGTYYEQTMSLGLIPRALNKSSSHIILVSV